MGYKRKGEGKTQEIGERLREEMNKGECTRILEKEKGR